MPGCYIAWLADLSVRRMFSGVGILVQTINTVVGDTKQFEIKDSPSNNILERAGGHHDTPHMGLAIGPRSWRPVVAWVAMLIMGDAFKIINQEE